MGKTELKEDLNLTSTTDGGRVISVNELARKDWLFKTGETYSKGKMVADFLRLGLLFLVAVGPWLILITVATGGIEWVTDSYYLGLFFLVWAFILNMENITTFMKDIKIG